MKELLDARLNGQISTPEQERALAEEKIAAILKERSSNINA